MQRIYKLREKSYFKWFVALLLTIAYFILIKKSFSFHLAISDDMQMRDILTGGYSGTPDAHLIYIKYVLGVLLVNLYKVLPGYNCYGLFMLALFALCFALIIFRVISIFKHRAIYSVLFAIGIFTIIALEHIVMMQFTLTASMLGITGLFWIFTSPETTEKKYCVGFDWGISVVLLILCFCIRVDVFLVNLPFCFLAYTWKYYTAEDKKKMRNIGLKIALAIICLVVIILGIEKAAYASPEWTSFKEFNNNRAYQVDYQGYPDYDDNAEVYRNLGISRESYDLLNEYCMILDDKADENAYKALAEKAKEENQNRLSIREKSKEIVTGIYRIMFSSDYSIYNYVIFAAAVMALIEVLRNRKYDRGIFTLAFIGLDALLWCYLIFKGRIPVRAGLTVALSASVFAICLLLIFVKESINIKDRHSGKILGALALVFLCFLVYNQVDRVRSKNEVMDYEYQNRTQLVNYCNQHEGNLYLIEMQSLSAFLGDNNIAALPEEGNTLSLGGWHIRSPLYYDKLERYGIDDVADALLNREDVFFVVSKTQAQISMDKYIKFFKSKGEEVVPELVDEFPLNEGNVGQIYRFNKE